MVFLEGLCQCVGQAECQAAATAQHALLDFELELVGAVPAVLNEVVGDILENRVRPQQVLGADRRRVAEAGVLRKDTEKRIRQIAIQVTVIREAYHVVPQAPAVHVVTVVYVDLIVARIGGLRHNSARQFMLESQGVLISPRNLEARRIETGAATNTGRQTQARSACRSQSIRKWVDQRKRPSQGQAS